MSIEIKPQNAPSAIQTEADFAASQKTLYTTFGMHSVKNEEREPTIVTAPDENPPIVGYHGWSGSPIKSEPAMRIVQVSYRVENAQ